jgi:hypothetical protein
MLQDGLWLGYAHGMGLRARVRNGRIVVDEPTDLPEGTVLNLVLDDGDDELGDDERRRLHAALEEGLAQLDADQGIPVGDVLRDLRSSRG